MLMSFKGVKLIIIIIINALFRKMVQTMSPTGDFQWAWLMYSRKLKCFRFINFAVLNYCIEWFAGSIIRMYHPLDTKVKFPS